VAAVKGACSLLGEHRSFSIARSVRKIDCGSSQLGRPFDFFEISDLEKAHELSEGWCNNVTSAKHFDGWNSCGSQFDMVLASI
jgi:hypothetical protein